MRITILGSGSGGSDTGAMVTLVNQVLGELDLSAEVTTLTDPVTVMGYGGVSTPALVIDQQVVHSGGVPSREHLIRLLAPAAGRWRGTLG